MKEWFKNERPSILRSFASKFPDYASSTIFFGNCQNCIEIGKGKIALEMLQLIPSDGAFYQV